MPSQDVPEPLVGEPDLTSMLVGEAAHAGVHHQKPYRKVYRTTASNGNTPLLDSTAFLLPAAGLSLGPGLLHSHVGADGDPRRDAHPLADHDAAPGYTLSAAIPASLPVCSLRSLYLYLSFRIVAAASRGPLASRYMSVDGPPGADGWGALPAASMPVSP